MQYILSEEEYKQLATKKDWKTGLNVSEDRLQELCTKIANEMPINWAWNGLDPKPWGCILSAPVEWYCDQCPVQDICPHPSKEWSQ